MERDQDERGRLLRQRRLIEHIAPELIGALLRVPAQPRVCVTRMKQFTDNCLYSDAVRLFRDAHCGAHRARLRQLSYVHTSHGQRGVRQRLPFGAVRDVHARPRIQALFADYGAAAQVRYDGGARVRRLCGARHQMRRNLWRMRSVYSYLLRHPHRRPQSEHIADVLVVLEIRRLSLSSL